jgi:multiple sugar transport system substrate-binding protein
MRFLISFEQLNNMARAKGMLPPTADLSFSGIYAPFNEIPADRIVTAEEFGLSDAVMTQVRNAAFQLAKGMSVDEAIAAYGTLDSK